MSLVTRYPLPDARELRTVRRQGKIFIDVRHIGGGSLASSLVIRDDDLDTLRSAMADLSGETDTVEATENDGASAVQAGRSARAATGGVTR